MLDTEIWRHDYEVHVEKASHEGGSKNCKYLACYHPGQSRPNILTIDAY